MKRTKNTARLLTLILVLCMVVIPFASCKKTQNVNGYCTVVVATDPATEYKVDLDKVTVDQGLVSILEYLKENEKDFTYEMVDSTYGAYLTKVLSLDATAVSNGFILLMTSVEKDFDVSEYKTEKEYKGTKVVTSGLGASSMTVENGAVYYIALSSY